MRRIVARPLALSLTLVFLGVFATCPTLVSAQQGVTAEILATGMPAEAGGLQLSLIRITFAPEEGSLAAHRHPGPMLLYIESGELVYTLMDGSAEVVRAAAPGAAATTEELTAGTETRLRAGDRLLERGVLHSAHNAGEEPTVVLISALLTPGQPVTQLVDR